MSESDMKAFECVDCTANTATIDEYYMVTDALWEQAGMEPHGGMLCIGCIENRVGRRLEPDDFPHYPVNFLPGFSRSLRLTSRLYGLRSVP